MEEWRFFTVTANLAVKEQSAFNANMEFTALIVWFFIIKDKELGVSAPMSREKAVEGQMITKLDPSLRSG